MPNDTEYKGYSLFNDTDNVKLRTWNRCATFFAIAKDQGLSVAKSYVTQLDDISRGQMTKMLEEIRENGYGTTRQRVLNTCKFH